MKVRERRKADNAQRRLVGMPMLHLDGPSKKTAVFSMLCFFNWKAAIRKAKRGYMVSTGRNGKEVEGEGEMNE